MVKASLIVIVGPTASGKSTLALELAEKFNGEIICADSQTVRRDMDIGTAKPSKADQLRVKHHLLDIVGPYERFSAAQFKRAALAVIDDITARGKLPIMVGGTGLYIDSVIFDFEFGLADAPRDPQNPRHLLKLAVDAPRALRQNTLLLGLDVPKDVLEKRIDQRIQAMLQAGFTDEVLRIVKKYGAPPANWDAIGYKLILEWLEAGGQDTNDLKQALLIATRQYAKRQRTWFKRNPHIQLFTSSEEALNKTTEFVAETTT